MSRGTSSGSTLRSPARAELQFAARVDGIRRADVQDAIADRRLVKTWVMRGTVHLLTSDDLWRIVAAWPARDNARSAAWLKYFKVTVKQLDAIAEAIGKVLDETPRTRAELAASVAEEIGDKELAGRLSEAPRRRGQGGQGRGGAPRGLPGSPARRVHREAARSLTATRH